MFWDNLNSETSSLSKLLETGVYTLDDLLFDEFFLQEFHFNNLQLLTFLLKPETVEQLIKHIITEPPADLDEKTRFKKAHVTCGLFAKDYNKIENVIVSNEYLMNLLLQFLNQTSPLHPLLKREDFFDKLINHVDTSAIMDFIETFFTTTKQMSLDKNDEEWINSSNFADKLLDVLNKERSSESHENASILLCRLIEFYRNPQYLEENERITILNRLESKEFITKLLDKILIDPTPSLLINGLNVILNLLDSQKHIRIVTYQSDGKTSGPENNAKKEAEHSIRFFDCVYNVHEAIMAKMADLKNILMNPIEKNPIESTTGLIETPFGTTRLKILTVLRSILIVNNPKVNIVIKDQQIFPLLIDLFFNYPWNNFLHNIVEQLVQTVLINLSPNSIQFIHLLDNKQANSTRLDESKIEDSTSEDHSSSNFDLHESAEMEITTLESTVANNSSMDITITDVHQNEFKPQESLFQILNQLIVKSRLLDRIIEQLTAVLNNPRTKSTTPFPAFNGHLVEIANRIEDSLKWHEFIKIEFERMLTAEQLEQWKTFVADDLVKFNEKNLTAIGQIRSDIGYKPVEFDNDKGMIDQMSSFLSKTLQPSFSIFENDPPVQKMMENLEGIQSSFDEHLAQSQQMLAQFEKLCSEQIKPTLFSHFLPDEDTASTEEQTATADNLKNQDTIQHSATEDLHSLDDANGSKKDDNSGFQVFFQPKASSSNLSSDLKMEIDPFLEIPSVVADRGDTPPWDSPDEAADNDIDNWADFSTFEKGIERENTDRQIPIAEPEMNQQPDVYVEPPKSAEQSAQSDQINADLAQSEQTTASSTQSSKSSDESSPTEQSDTPALK